MEKHKIQEMYRVVNERCSHYEDKYLKLEKTSREYERSKQQYLYHKKLAKHYQSMLDED